MGAIIIALVRYEEDIATAKLCSPIGGYVDSTACREFNDNGWKMLLAEVVGTFLFVSVNVNIIYSKDSTELILNAIIIGLALTLGIFVAAPISGGSINPAVGIVLPIMQNAMFGTPTSQMTVHIFGPFIGGGLAGLA